MKKDNYGADYFAKLAFVPGFHTGDSLYLMVNDKKVDTLNLATPNFNVAKFSFRYEDVEAGSFKIQTAFQRREYDHRQIQCLYCQCDF